MAPRFFAELLARIGGISIVVEDPESQLEVESLNLPDRGHLSLNLQGDHHRHQLLLPLPTEVPTQSQLEQSYSVRNGAVQIRLQVPVDSLHNNRNAAMMPLVSSSYKWNARQLQKLKHYTIRCALCDTLLLDSVDVTSTSEMPSEMWAEMMDFWHCHKPHKHDHSHEANSQRFTSLKPVRNGLIVAAYYFAFNKEDSLFQNIVNHQQQQQSSLNCSKCDSNVGEFDKSTGLNKLFKWSLHLSHDNITEDYQPFNYVYNTLLDNVNSNATRIVEFANKDETKRVLIWVFNVGVDFTVTGSAVTRNAMKVYYTTDADSIESERNGRGEMELVIVSDVVLDSTIAHLQQYKDKLPRSIRTMGKNWQMGLISADQ